MAVHALGWSYTAQPLDGYLYSIGNNENATNYSGVPVRKDQIP